MWRVAQYEKGYVTYCDFKTYWFVSDLPVDHGGLQEGTEEEELVHFPSGTLMKRGGARTKQRV